MVTQNIALIGEEATRSLLMFHKDCQNQFGSDTINRAKIVT